MREQERLIKLEERLGISNTKEISTTEERLVRAVDAIEKRVEALTKKVER